MKYTVTFDRVGRNRSVPPLVVDVLGEADLLRSVRAHVRPHIRSRDFDIMLDVDAIPCRGWIACGFHSGGDFAVSKS